MKKYISILILSVLFLSVRAQKELVLTLNDALRLTQSQSLQAFMDKYEYIQSYWDYKVYKADYLPTLSLELDPVSYYNYSALEYNSTSGSYSYYRTQYMSSDATVSLSQNIAATGGTLTLNSNLYRLQNYGDYDYTQFSSAPFTIGYSQDLFGFNALKWKKKVQPLEYEKAKKEYISSVEEMNSTTVEKFFNLALAELQLNMSEFNYGKTDTLLQIAEKRFLLGTQTKEELIDLKLSKNNTYINWQEAKLNLQKCKDDLLNYLMLPKGTDIKVVLPKDIPAFRIEADQVLQYAMENNPDVLQQKISVVEADRDVAEAKAENRFSADMSVYYGISKDDGSYGNNGKVSNVYKSDFDDYQRASLNVTIPVLDWGKGKGNVEVAKSQQKIAELTAQQTMQEFELSTVTKAMEFNIQRNKVTSAVYSETLANESYLLTTTRFKKGQVNVLQLVSSQTAKDNAEEEYISALSDFWKSYYDIRKITLYDFENDLPLDAVFENIIDGIE